VADYERTEHLNERKERIMGLTATSSGKDFELAPIGVHPARCYRIIDLGTQTTNWEGQTKRAHKVVLTWELLGDERMGDGRPFSISKRFTMSTHEKSVLRPFLESWRGRAFTPEEIARFDVTAVLGAPCLLNVTHDQGKDGTTYANIAGCMPLPKGMPKPEPVNPQVTFDLDNPDMKLFESFGQKLQATIMSAEEWLKKSGERKGDAFESDDSTGSDNTPEIPF